MTGAFAGTPATGPATHVRSAAKPSSKSEHGVAIQGEPHIPLLLARLTLPNRYRVDIIEPSTQSQAGRVALWLSPVECIRLNVSETDIGRDVNERAFNAGIGQRVRAARVRTGLTQELLARKTGLTRGSITNIESGVQAPPPYRLARIAAALEVEPAELLPPLVDAGPAHDLPEHLADVVASVVSAAQKMRGSDGQG
ncbi:helix-turn-helix domain-containing protein [Embleya sp. NPDC055664]